MTLKKKVINIELKTTYKGESEENGYYILLLECGHTVYRQYQIRPFIKLTKPAPKATKCELCKALRDIKDERIKSQTTR